MLLPSFLCPCVLSIFLRFFFPRNCFSVGNIPPTAYLGRGDSKEDGGGGGGATAAAATRETMARRKVRREKWGGPLRNRVSAATEKKRKKREREREREREEKKYFLDIYMCIYKWIHRGEEKKGVGAFDIFMRGADYTGIASANRSALPGCSSLTNLMIFVLFPTTFSQPPSLLTNARNM